MSLTTDIETRHIKKEKRITKTDRLTKTMQQAMTRISKLVNELKILLGY